MFQNYEYFLTLAETLNMSAAAQKLYISHQCLSRYLKTLEQECGVTLFERHPSLRLTPSGQILLHSFQELQRIEQNTRSALSDTQNRSVGEVRFGLTEGRLRIFLPPLLKAFHPLFPDVTIKAVSAPTQDMLKQLSENKLDIVLGSSVQKSYPNLEQTVVLEENLYLVVSDVLLQQYFPDRFPACKEEFSHGTDLHLFQNLPFCMAHQGYHSRRIIDDYLQKNGLSLDIIYEGDQPDLLHILSASDYACSVCLSMYLPNVRTLNQAKGNSRNQLNIFPISGLDAKNPISLYTVRGKYLPRYAKELYRLIQQQCKNEYEI